MRQPGGPGRRPPLGFTLLELLVVLVIMAAAATLVTSSLARPMAKADFRAVRDSLVGELRLARSDAVTTGRETVVALDPRQRWFQRDGGKRHPIPAGVQLDVVSAQEAATTESETAIRFFPDGESTGGRIRLTADGLPFEVLVHWRTGLVLPADGADAR
ncbi:GspH/FimT family protein [Inquilinus sp. NPDC058860]|uniref:GspH/FimT family protein n=1 Tax=Inquilinus sp. NPDC058860 TaxID=3346652 RepID=UPI0036768A99